MNTDLNWREYFDIADQDIPYEDKLNGYIEIARRRFNLDDFRDFCKKHLSHFDEVAYEYFGSESVRAAIRQKVESLFPEHEHDEFTELFWSRIQDWRRIEGGKPEEL